MREDLQPFEEKETWLTRGAIEPVGRIVRSWNQVFLVRVDDGQQHGLAIYKPRAGEYPLWDFPHGSLCLREMAAYHLSRALGWPHIPPTVLRDGPNGFGMVQQFIEADPKANYFTLRQDRLPDLLPVALFDCLVNNTDRKGGHLLLDRQGHIWAIDHASPSTWSPNCAPSSGTLSEGPSLPHTGTIWHGYRSNWSPGKRLERDWPGF